MLHLLEHVLGRDDEDAITAPALDELGEDEADFDRFAEPDRVGKEDARPQVLRIEDLAHRCLLVLLGIDEHAIGHGEVRIFDSGCRLHQSRFQPELGVAIARALVVDEWSLSGVDRSDRVDRVEEDCGRVTDEFGESLYFDPLDRLARCYFLVSCPFVDRLNTGDEPLFVADLDYGSGGEGGWLPAVFPALFSMILAGRKHRL